MDVLLFYPPFLVTENTEKRPKKHKKVPKKEAKKGSLLGQKGPKSFPQITFFSTEKCQNSSKSDPKYSYTGLDSKKDLFWVFFVFLDLSNLQKGRSFPNRMCSNLQNCPKTVFFGVISGVFGSFWPFLALFDPFLDLFWTPFWTPRPKNSSKPKK
jgi:hypothetical protein